MAERIIGGYEVKDSFRIGKFEIALCENRGAPPDEVYLCGLIESNGIVEMLTDCMASDSFADISTCYGEKIAEKAEEVQKESEEIARAVGNNPELTARDCSPISDFDCIEGRVIVLKGDAMRPEFKRATSQLLLCTGGFGSQANARGRTCFATRIYDGEKTSCHRGDVLGVMEEDKLPEWAEERLTGILRQIRDERNKRDTRGDR